MRDKVFGLVLIWSTLFFVWALAWTNPPGNPPTGGGALRVDEPTQEILFLPAAPARRVSVVGGDFRMDNNRYVKFLISGGGAERGFRLNAGNNLEWGDPAATSPLFTVLNNGNLGLGVISPSEKLDLSGELRWGGTADRLGGLESDGANSFLYFNTYYDTGYKSRIGTGQSSILQIGNNGLYLYGENANMIGFTPGTSKFRVAGDGRVGINTDLLTGTDKFVIVGNGAGAGTIAVSQDGHQLQFQTAGTKTISFPGGSNLVFTGGNVGIASSTPDQKLSVGGSINISGSYLKNGSPIDQLGGSGTINFLSKFIAATTLGNSIIFDNGTNVGVGTSTPLAKLDVAGRLVLSSPTADLGGNLRFETATPIIFASNRTYFPGGVYVSSTGNIFADATLFANGGIEDNGGPLVLSDDVQITPTLAAQIPLTLRKLGAGNAFVVRDSGDTRDAFIVSDTGSSTLAGDLRFLELPANGTNYVGFKATTTLAADLIWTLPPADGTAGQILQTNGAGLLSWTTPAGGVIGGGGTLNRVPKFTPNGITLGDSLIFDDGTNVGIGTIAPSAKLHIARAQYSTGTVFAVTFVTSTSLVGYSISNTGEARSADPASTTINRLWGQGRPGSVLVDNNGECNVGGLKISRSERSLHWDAAAAACPAGWWVCTKAERGSGACGSATLRTVDCVGGDTTGLGAWISDGPIPPANPHDDSRSGYRVTTAGALAAVTGCTLYPVWCCAY